MSNYISTKEALQYLNIKSLNQLNNLCKIHNIEKKSLGAGKGNAFNRSDVERAVGQRKLIKTNVKEVKKKIVEISINPPAPKIKSILEELGQKEYSRVKNILESSGLFEDVDEAVLQVYAIAYQNYFYCHYELAKCGGVEYDYAGNLKPSIYQNIQNIYFKQMMDAAKILGIGALNRQKIEQTEKPKTDEMAGLIN